MDKTSSLKSRIISQFLIIILPLLLVLIYQAVSDARRAANLQRAFELHELIHEAKTQYKTFVNGVVDAVDTGNVGSGAIAALGNARTKVQSLGEKETERDFKEFLGKLGSVHQAISANASITAVLPLRETINQLDKKLSEMDVNYEEINHKAIVQTLDSSERQKFIVAAATLFTLLITDFFIWRMIRGLTEPLNEAESLAHRIADGEIRSNCRASSAHDIGNLMVSLCSMNNNLYRIISSVQQASGTVSGASSGLSETAREVMSAAQRQQDTVARTRSDIEAMNESILQVSQRAVNAQEQAARTEEVAQAGSTNMAKSLAATERVVETVETTAQALGQLTGSVQKINEFTQTIREIADQTNLLALNAAIEAARAGEQGRGFAVVADEVRKLAERTAAGTAEIANMVTTIHGQTGEAVKAMDRVKEEVAQGAGYSRTTSGILQQMVDAARASAERAKQNAAAAEEQLNVARKAVANTEQITAISEENATYIQEMHQSASGLANTATELQKLIAQFKLG
jgi:methyl-accepting chemotaxis protein